MRPPRIAVPEPTSTDPSYNQRCWPQYAHAIHSCGGVAVPIPLSESQAGIARTISGCCAILLPGSPADLNPQKYGEAAIAECARPDPEREAVDELLLQDAFNLRKPILGICYGHQALNVWRGGTLLQHIGEGLHDRSQLSVAHSVTVSTDSRLGSLLCLPLAQPSEEVSTNSSHHQAVGIVGDGMRIVGVSSGDGIVEATELSSTQFVIGVQWHPERTFGRDRSSRAIFQGFVDAAANWRLEPITSSVVPASICSSPQSS